MLVNVLKWLLLAIFFVIPFGAKKFIYNFSSPLGDELNVFLYASDLLGLVFLFFWLKNNPKLRIYPNAPNKIRIALFLFLTIAFISVFLANYKLVAFYHFIRLLFLVVMAVAIGDLLKKGIASLESIAKVMAVAAVLQSLIAFWQFKFQESLGLGFLGESVVNSLMPEVAKVVIEGGKLIRGYGTMPHSNILAAFLILGLLSLYYLFLRNYEKVRKYENLPVGGTKVRKSASWRNENTKASYERILIIVGIFFVWLGLIVTFSRSGWIVAIMTTLLFVIGGLWNKIFWKQTIYLFAILLFTFYFLLSAMGWAIIPRVHLAAGEPSVNYRILYNKVGLETIVNNPLGVGMSNQVLYGMENGLYEKFGMKKMWESQPTHNLYILMAAEIGVLGLAAFFLFILSISIFNFSPFGGSLVGKQFSIFNKFLSLRDISRRETMIKFQIVEFQNLSVVSCQLLLVAMLLFGLFDHFSWDLWQGELMLWAILGILMGISPHSSMDPAQK